MALGDIKTFDYVYGVNGADLTLKIVAIDMGVGGTRFMVSCEKGYADINALYWGDNGVADTSQFDLGTNKDNSLNMNGAQLDGAKVDFDGGVKLSSVGLGQPVVMPTPIVGDTLTAGGKLTYLTAGESFHMDNAIAWDTIDVLGVRATSTLAGGGSIKGVDGGDNITEAPKVKVDGACVTEGNPGDDVNMQFTIRLEKAYTYDVYVSWATDLGDGSDYVNASGVVKIPAGSLEALVPASVHIVSDGIVEGNDTFGFHLTNVATDIPGGVPGVPELQLPGAICVADVIGTVKNDDHNPVAVDFVNEACGIEAYGNHAAVNVTGYLLNGDSDVDGDDLSITQIMYQGQSVGFANGSPIALGNLGTLTVQANGNYSFHYTGPGIPDGTMATIEFSYQIADEHGNTISNNSDTDSVAKETICVDAAPPAPDLIPPDCPADGVELLANNGFEVDKVQGDLNSSFLTQTPTGWYNVDNAPKAEVPHENYDGHVLQGFGADQDQWLDSAETPGDLHIAQNILNLAAGEEFHLGMSIAAEKLTFGNWQTPNGASVDLVWNDEVVMHIELDDLLKPDNSIDWNQFHQFATEVIGDDDGTNTLEIVSHGQAGTNVGFAIDYVSLQGCEEIVTPPPAVETDGLSKGAWQTPLNGAGDWTETTYHTGDSYEGTFGINSSLIADSTTLLESLTLNTAGKPPANAGEGNLAQQATAALLNANSDGEATLTADYRFSEQQVKDAVQKVYDGGFHTAMGAQLADVLEFWNTAPEHNTDALTGVDVAVDGELHSDDPSAIAQTLIDGLHHGGSFTGDIFQVMDQVSHQFYGEAAASHVWLV